MTRGTYLTLYFNEREERELLRWIFAIRRSRRSEVLKRVLARHLPTFLQRADPEIQPLSNEELARVRALRRRPGPAASAPSIHAHNESPLSAAVARQDSGDPFREINRLLVPLRERR